MDIFDALFSDGSYRTAAPEGGYADVYRQGLLARNRNREPTSVEAMRASQDFVPVLGDLLAFGEAGQALSEGDRKAAALLAAGGLLGVVPGAGDALARPVVAAGRAVIDRANQPGAVPTMYSNPLMGGGMSDPTQTGWTFRDVSKPTTTKADNRRISGDTSRIEEVPINRLYATQPTVNTDFATTSSSAGEMPLVVRKGGKMFVQDGHHRLTKQAEGGAQTAQVRFIDLDNADTSTPLLDWSPEKTGFVEADQDLLDELFSTPASQEIDTSYRMEHQPVGPQDENPIRLDDLTKSTTGEMAGYPKDFYGPQGMRFYAQPPSFPGDEYGMANQQSYRAIQAVRGNPDAEVTIYRGVPDEDSITSINPGDFVTLSPKYAELHASSGYGPRGEDAGKVISQKVKVRDVYFAGDDVNEFGYFPDQGANTKKGLLD